MDIKPQKRENVEKYDYRLAMLMSGIISLSIFGFSAFVGYASGKMLFSLLCGGAIVGLMCIALHIRLKHGNLPPSNPDNYWNKDA